MDLSTSRANEAAVLLEVNQRRRGHAEATLMLVAVLAVAVTAAAIGLHRASIFLPLPPVALVLISLTLQQYADVTVIGVARRVIERTVNETAGSSVLLYETEIAGIRKGSPLVTSVRVLQAVTWAGLCGGAIAGMVIASDQAWWALPLYAAAIAAAGTSCVLSFRAMRRAEPATTDALGFLAAPRSP